MKTFTERVLYRAVVDTWSFFGVNLRTAVPVFYLVLGTAVHFWAAGWNKVVEEWSVWASYVLAPTVVFALVLFLWNLFLAPFRLVDEKLNAALAGGGSQPANLRMFDFEPPNYGAWRACETAAIVEIARLCAEEEPHSTPMSGREKPFVNLIMDGVRVGEVRRSDAVEVQVTAISEDDPEPRRQKVSTPLDQSSQVYIEDVAAFFKKRGVSAEFFDGEGRI